jgi:hypothetical protein
MTIVKPEYYNKVITNKKKKNVSWTLFAWRLSRPRMPGQQVPCSIRVHAQCDVEEQRLLL